MMKLKNIKVLITGSSQGLGKAIAEQFLQEGASVVLCARSEGDLTATSRELAERYPAQAVYAKTCDVSNESQVNELVDFTLKSLGSLDVLVLCAGVYGPMGPTESVLIDEWRRALEINLFGVLFPCRALMPHFKNSGRGKIIVLSGGGATSPLPNISAYAASKAAVVRLMETLAEELKPFGASVNAIAPGAMATRLLDQVLEAGPEIVGKAYYEKNKGWKENGAVPLSYGAGLALFLASSESDGITGKLISAQWDPWKELQAHQEELANSDIYCLRRIVPADRGKTWGDA